MPTVECLFREEEYYKSHTTTSYSVSGAIRYRSSRDDPIAAYTSQEAFNAHVPEQPPFAAVQVAGELGKVALALRDFFQSNILLKKDTPEEEKKYVSFEYALRYKRSAHNDIDAEIANALSLPWKTNLADIEPNAPTLVKRKNTSEAPGLLPPCT